MTPKLNFSSLELSQLRSVSHFRFISWSDTIWGPAIVMVRACPSVRLSVCLSHANIYETKRDRLWLLGNSNRKIRTLWFRICHQIRYRHFRCFQVGNLPIQTEMGSWPSEWIGGNSQQSRQSSVIFFFQRSCAHDDAHDIHYETGFSERKREYNHIGHRGGPANRRNTETTSANSSIIHECDICHVVTHQQGATV